MIWFILSFQHNMSLIILLRSWYVSKKCSQSFPRTQLLKTGLHVKSAAFSALQGPWGPLTIWTSCISWASWSVCWKSRIKVENILKGSLDSIPSPSVKIQIMGRKVCLMCNSKTLLDIVNKPLETKSLLTSPSNVLSYYLM